ncbi:MAG: IclR family transcriptional regulator [Desulfosarcina sp.]|nr:IclR family transcriptional regulator [Desulfobacterales bacterium]
MLKIKNAPKESAKQIESVDKALSILECFSDSVPELSLKQLSEKTGLYKSRILRLCGTLMAHGFLIRTEGSLYRLGPKLMMLGKIYERSNSLISIARPILRELASITGESAKLFIIQGTRRICLVREKGSNPLSYHVEEGESFELYAGASGKVLLAYSSKEFRDQVLGEKVLQRLTPATIVERSRLEEEFTAIRKQGYALSQGELFLEVAGLAAPVSNHESTVCGAIAIAGPIQRFTEDRHREMLDSLLEAANKLSQLLGNVG